ncbi:MAG TPA: dienelactone hydrolase family protein [Dongiaceae bacterium]|nr:dienelactone hydrolase family protein [Dongiaceae bacterium]
MMDVERRALERARPLAAVLADPKLAAAEAAALETVTIATPSGRQAKGALAKPARKGPAILLIHEWWGLNDQIKSVAAEFANQGYLALACDLYEGTVTTDPGKASALMEALDQAKARETLTAWVNWLRKHPDGNGKVATIGWCMGGGLSLAASIDAAVDATIIYYGNVNFPAAELAKLKGPLLGQFAEKDGWINHPMVDPFAANLKKLGKKHEIHWYDADHAFANPTRQHYDKADAALAWSRTLEFLKANL